MDSKGTERSQSKCSPTSPCLHESARRTQIFPASPRGLARAAVRSVTGDSLIVPVYRASSRVARSNQRDLEVQRGAVERRAAVATPRAGDVGVDLRRLPPQPGER